MSNIISYGISIPQFQIEDSVLHPKFGKKKGKRTITYIDEDIITLSYDAATDCLEKYASDKNRKSKIDAIFFASTTPVFKNRYHASFLADMLNLPEGIMALDLCSTSRSGTDAVLLANQLIDAGKYNNILVVAADTYYPPIGEELRAPFGHAGCALLLGKDKGIAGIRSTQSFSNAIAEQFNYKGSKVQLDARFSRDAGFKSNLNLALEKFKYNPSDIDKVILNSPYAKIATGILKKNGFDIENQLLKDNLMLQTGFTASCHSLLLLIENIENNSGNILLMDCSNGTNMLQIEHCKTNFSLLKNSFQNKTEIKSYQDYLTLRKAGKFDSKAYKTIEIFSSEMMQEREKETILYLNGFECSSCGTVYFIKSARCKKCKGTEFSLKQLAKTGVVYSLTKEHYFPTSFPPVTMAVIDLDGGGRITVQQTDDMYPENNKIQIDSKVKLVLRKMMENDNKPNYFWKCKLINV